jgi:hypothetical protein
VRTVSRNEPLEKVQQEVACRATHIEPPFADAHQTQTRIVEFQHLARSGDRRHHHDFKGPVPPIAHHALVLWSATRAACLFVAGDDRECLRGCEVF